MNLETRIATLADLKLIAPLFNAYRQFYEQADDLDLATHFIQQRLEKNESIIFLSFDQSNPHRPLGFCQVYPSFCSVIAAPIYVLYDLFVTPEARKMGIGRLLLLAAESHAMQNNIQRMDLTTAKNNLTAQSVYESLGWIRDEVFYTYNKNTKKTHD